MTDAPLQTALKRDHDHFTRKEAAHYLTTKGCPISAATLAGMASNDNAGKGPPFTRFRWKRVIYLRKDLDEWMAKQTTRVE